MRALLCCLALVCAVAVQGVSFPRKRERTEPVSVVHESHPMFLEAAAGYRASCSDGFRCPIVDGDCCPGGMQCCPHRCAVGTDGKNKCEQSDASKAQKLLYETYKRKQFVDDQEAALAKEQEEQERKKAAEIARSKEKKEWSRKISAAAQRKVESIQAKKKKLLTKLRTLVKGAGTTLQRVVPKSEQKKIAKGLTKAQAKKLKLKKKKSTKNGKKTKGKKTGGKKAKGKKTGGKKAKGKGKEHHDDEHHKEHHDDEHHKEHHKKEHHEHHTDDELMERRHEKLTRLRPAGGWSNHGYKYDVLRIQQWRHFCLLSGMVKGKDGVVAQVPKSCRPRGGRLIFNALKDNEPSRVDILKDGRVYLMSNTKQVGWLSLSGITWDVQNGTKLFLTRNWRAKHGQYRTPQITRIGDLCMSTGVIRNGRWGTMGEVSKTCRPEKEIIASANNNVHPVRVDVHKNGTFGTVAGTYKHTWLSLSPLVWTRTKGEDIYLLNKWENHLTKKYRKASYQRVGNVVVLSGLLKPGILGQIGRLPPGYRPFNRLAFNTNHHTGLTRIDITKEGDIIYVAGRQFNWISLDGISFYAERRDHEAQRDEEARLDVEEDKRNGRTPEKHEKKRTPELDNMEPLKKNLFGQKREAKIEEAKKVAKQLAHLTKDQADAKKETVGARRISQRNKRHLKAHEDAHIAEEHHSGGHDQGLDF